MEQDRTIDWTEAALLSSVPAAWRGPGPGLMSTMDTATTHGTLSSHWSGPHTHS